MAQGITNPFTAQGIPGATGAPGTNGNTVLYGGVDPTTEGVDGNFYINNASNYLFGPKAGGTWPAGVSLVGPQGPQGPAGGGGGAVQKTYNVLDYGAVGNNSTNDSTAFQNCFNAAIAANGKVIIPAPNVSYRLTSTITINSGSNQCWIDVEGWGRPGNIRYAGSAGTPCFRIYGLKGCLWIGTNVALETSNSQAFDIDTTVAANSSSFNTFKNMYINLGTGADNVGFRTGHDNAPGGADISNYQWENVTVFGGFHPGGNGQIAYLNEGNNTLSQTWIGGFVADCAKAYSNIGPTGIRGNGSVFFYGMGCSHNGLDYDINFEQTYLISGGRYEVGGQFMKIGNGAYALVTVQNITIHDYSQGSTGAPLLHATTAASISLNNVSIIKTTQGSLYADVVSLDSNAGGVAGQQGCLFIQGGAIGMNATNPYSKSGTTPWDVTVLGVAKSNGVWSNPKYPNQVGVTVV